MDDLISSSRDMNRVFGICADVLNTARLVRQSAFEMELLARNGVVQAAKLAAGRGGSLSVLAEFLAGLAGRIRPNVDRLETLCSRLAGNTSDCSNVARLSYQLVGSLQASVPNTTPAGETGPEAEEDRMGRRLTPREVERLMDRIPANETNTTRRNNLSLISRVCVRNLERTSERLEDSCGALSAIRNDLKQIQMIGATARYAAQFVAIEASRIQERRSNFENLSKSVHATVDQLDENLSGLLVAMEKGERLLTTLHGEVTGA